MTQLSLLFDPFGHPLSVFRLGTVQNVSYNAAGGASSIPTNALKLTTVAVMISTTTSDVRISIGASPVASSTTTLIPKPFVGVFQCNGAVGETIAVLGNDATTGSICLTELGSNPGAL